MEKFKFIDLFAGIGGFHLALHSLGGECVFASEIDPYARKTYEHNYRKLSPELFESGMFNDDIRKISPAEIPDFDILCAGFPCQPFSQAGQKRGFNDTHKSERGNLFFNIVDIISEKRPKAFFLENVRGIVSHDNGNTFRVIREILEDELGYSFYYKIVHASDYGLPQLRPRAFMIGFRDETALKGFSFPPPLPLKFNMSDVWQGECTREIGFTVRVGGRGSSIDDRRNWDSYLVDGKVRKLMPEQAKKMQGFPDEFEFPVASMQAMKQLGNSVAVDAIRACAQSILEHLTILATQEHRMTTDNKNKGEWTELYSLVKFMHDKKLLLADKDLNPLIDESSFSIKKVSTLNSKADYILHSDDLITLHCKNSNKTVELPISSIVNEENLHTIASEIRNGTGRTFVVHSFRPIQEQLQLEHIKGGNSKQKSDIVLDLQNQHQHLKNTGFGIKSYLGASPTLLNASSSNTNFIFEVKGIDVEKLDEINCINTRNKVIDRIYRIKELGGEFEFSKVESETMAYNLALVDELIPKVISKMLLEFYLNRTYSFKENLSNVTQQGQLAEHKHVDDVALEVKTKRFLLSNLLGFFAGTKWDGRFISDGCIVVKENGSQVGFHVSKVKDLEEYLFENIRFDSPSTTRHRYGSLIAENNGKLYFKLNLQLRFKQI